MGRLNYDEQGQRRYQGRNSGIGRARAWLALGALALPACPAPAPRVHTEVATPTSLATTAPGIPRVAGTAPAASEPPSLAEDEPVVSHPKPNQLHLPQDVQFVQQVLPVPDAARYASFREQARINVGQGYLHHLDLLGGGRALLVASNDEATVRLYDTSSKRLLANIALPGQAQFETGGAVAWPELANDGPLRFLAATSNGVVLVSAVGTGQLTLLDNNPAQELAWSPDRQVLVTNVPNINPQSSVLRFFSRRADSLEHLGTLDFDERIDGWDLSRDNRLLAVSHYPSGDLRVIDLHSGDDLIRLPGPRYAGDVALSPDGRYVAVGGAGLLVVDLLNPSRRAYHGHFYNNLDTVRFSPSGDAVVVSAYDGRVRIFVLDPLPMTVPSAGAEPRAVHGLQLRLVKELRHSGQANVYALVFDDDGNGLWSASGDQTVRWFRGSAGKPRAGNVAEHFRSLQQWRDEAPEAAPWPPPLEPSMSNGHWVPPDMNEAARPTRLALGKYGCRLTKEYRFRDCWVTRDGRGHTWLEFDKSNLLGLRGRVYDDGQLVRFEGWLTERTNLIGCPGCERQPINGVLRGAGTTFSGVITFRDHYDPFVPPPLPPANVKVEDANDRYLVELRLVERAAVPQPRKSPRNPADHPGLELNEP